MASGPGSTLHTHVTSVHLRRPQGHPPPSSDAVVLPARNQRDPSNNAAVNLSNSANAVVCHIEDRSSGPENASPEVKVSIYPLSNASHSPNPPLVFNDCGHVQTSIGGGLSGSGSDIISGDVPSLDGNNKGVVRALSAVRSGAASVGSGGGGGGHSSGGGSGGSEDVDEGVVAVVEAQEKRHSHQSAASTESASSESSATRRTRHLAKKVSERCLTWLRV